MSGYRWDETGMANWRDLGLSLEGQGAANIIAHGALSRCGLNSGHCASWASLGCPVVKMNFRPGPDDNPVIGPCVELHLRPPDGERYDLGSKAMRQWVVEVLRAIAHAPAGPMLLHCKSGKDRTGVIVAAICAAMRVPQPVVRREFELSAGGRIDLFESLTLPALFPGTAFFDDLGDADLALLRTRLGPGPRPEECLPPPGTRERMAELHASLQRQLSQIAEENGRASGVLDLACSPVSASEYAELQVLRQRHPKHLLQMATRQCSKEVPVNHGGYVSHSTQCATVADAPDVTAASSSLRPEAGTNVATNLDTSADAMDGDDAQHEVIQELLEEDPVLTGVDLLSFQPLGYREIRIDKVAPRLYLGSRHEATDWKGLRKLGVSAIVNVAAGDCQNLYEDMFTYHNIVVSDKKDLQGHRADILRFLDPAADFIAERLQTGACFVHCMGGFSRSPTVVLAYLIKHGGLNLTDAIALVKRGRPKIEPNEGFIQQLRTFEKKHRSV